MKRFFISTLSVLAVSGLAISALAVLATSASSLEQTPSSKEASSNKNAASFNASRLHSATANRSGFDNDKEDHALDLSANNNSFSLDAGDVSTPDLIIRSANLGQSDYSAATTIIKF